VSETSGSRQLLSYPQNLLALFGDKYIDSAVIAASAVQEMK
jgi:hypothetical protein